MPLLLLALLLSAREVAELPPPGWMGMARSPSCQTSSTEHRSTKCTKLQSWSTAECTTPRCHKPWRAFASGRALAVAAPSAARRR